MAGGAGAGEVVENQIGTSGRSRCQELFVQRNRMTVRKIEAKFIYVTLPSSRVPDYGGHLTSAVGGQKHFSSWLCGFIFPEDDFVVPD